MTDKVNLVEIGPRDGFQNVKEFIPTEVKLNIIDGLVKAGYKKIQVGSFVSPKAIPQMKDVKEVVGTVIEKYPEVEWYALVPNLYGAKAAFEAGINEVSPVMSLSETHNENNVRKTKEESIQEIKSIVTKLPEMKVMVDIATVFGCPFEGEQKIEDLVELIAILNEEAGIEEFTLCDTIGVAVPTQVEEVFTTVIEKFPSFKFNAHIHDTRNMGIINSYIAHKAGAHSIQTTVGGLGGCPFAPGASGNTSSEDLVYMLNESGYETGIDFEVLLKTAKYTKEQIPSGDYSGHHINI